MQVKGVGSSPIQGQQYREYTIHYSKSAAAPGIPIGGRGRRGYPQGVGGGPGVGRGTDCHEIKPSVRKMRRNQDEKMELPVRDSTLNNVYNGVVVI
jgi:hypothetical protein